MADTFRIIRSDLVVLDLDKIQKTDTKVWEIILDSCELIEIDSISNISLTDKDILKKVFYSNVLTIIDRKVLKDNLLGETSKIVNVLDFFFENSNEHVFIFDQIEASNFCTQDAKCVISYESFFNR